VHLKNDLQSQFKITLYQFNAKYSEPKIACILSETQITQSDIHQSKMQTLGEMVGAIAHEINNPLALISTHTQHLKSLQKAKKLTEDKIEQTLNKIETITMRVAHIVKNLKRFSHESSIDTPSIDFCETHLDHIFKDVSDLCQFRIKETGIDFSQSCPAGIQIVCDPVHITQVLVNLIHNSIDAVSPLPDKWIKLHAELYQEQLILSVVDSGSGIDPFITQHLMQPYFTTKSTGQGSGLGLAISKKLIENHGGKLVYDSQSRHTCFKITLPLGSLNAQPKVAV